MHFRPVLFAETILFVFSVFSVSAVPAYVESPFPAPPVEAQAQLGARAVRARREISRSETSGFETEPLVSLYFDESGRPVEHVSYSSGVFQWRSIYSYDDQSRLESWESYDESGNRRWSYRYVYDDSGRLEQEIETNEHGRVETVQRYEYGDGNLVEHAQYDGLGALQWSRLYEYVPQELRVEWLLVYPDGGVVKRTEAHLNPFGRVVREVHYDETLEVAQTAVYSYDGAGRRVLTRIEDPAGDLRRRIQRQYNDRGDILREERHEAAEDSATVRTWDYRYDSSGNWIERIESIHTARDGTAVRDDQERIVREIEYW